MGLAPVINPVRSNSSHPWPPTVENPHRVNNVLSLHLWHSIPKNHTRLKLYNHQHLRSSRSLLAFSPPGCPCSKLITLPKIIPCSTGEARAMARRRQRPVAWFLIVTQLNPPPNGHPTNSPSQLSPNCQHLQVGPPTVH